MYQVLLVDDEPTVLQGLRMVIPWKDIGFEVVGEASNGEEAIEQIEELHPHLVVTDVRMPKMDGISLADWIHEHYPQTAVIIVSGYDEFDYAQSALKAGVSEYLLKPLKRKQWEETLRRVYQQLSRRQKQKEAYERMEQELEHYRPVIKNQFLADLAGGNLWEAAPFARLKELGTKLLGAPYYLVCFDSDHPNQSLASNGDLLCLYQRDVALHRFLELGPVESFHQENRWYYLVEDTGKICGFEEALESACREAMEDFYQAAGISMSAGVSLSYESLEELPKARQDCEMALEYRLSGGGENCIFAGQLGALAGGGISFRTENLDTLVNYLRLLEADKAKAMVKRQFDGLKRENALASQYYCLAHLVLLELYHLTSINGSDKSLSAVFQGRMSSLSQYKTASRLLSFCQETIDDVLSQLKKQTKETNKEIVGQITSYVQAHLGEELSLQMVAEHVHVSRNYLCSIFRREFDETFLSYLTRLRMNKAKELLRESRMKTYEIAAAVGYNDYVYFAQVFKKQAGVTTTEYRKGYGSKKE